MAHVRTITVIVKLPGNRTQIVEERIPADWVTGEKDAMSELLENARIRTKISVVAEHVISVQISDAFDSTGYVGMA